MQSMDFETLKISGLSVIKAMIDQHTETIVKALAAKYGFDKKDALAALSEGAPKSTELPTAGSGIRSDS